MFEELEILTDEEKIFILEDKLIKAYSLAQFLTGCLDEPETYVYEYPEISESTLREIYEFIGPQEFCVHSKTVEGCAACEQRNKRFKKRAEINKKLGIE